MKKTCVFLAGMLIILITFACEMPNSVEFKSDKFEMNAPAKIGRFNFASVLSSALKNSFAEEDFRIYDMTKITDVQAFLITYERDLMESFNPDDYLKKLKTPEGIPPINETINIPKMTSDTMPDKRFEFNMQPFFDDMQGKINTDSVPPTTIPLIFEQNQETVQSVDMSGAHFLDFMVFKDEVNGGTKNFEAVFVNTGEIVVDIDLGGSIPGLEITLHDIQMTGPIYDHDVTPPSSQTVVLNSGNSNKTITIDIGKSEIEESHPLRFSIGRIESTLNGYTTPTPLILTLVMQPTLNNLTLSGARGLVIGSMDKDLAELPDIIDNIELGSVDGMISADIAEGHFRIKATPPAYTDDDTTYCEGLKVGYRIRVEQDSVVVSGVSNPFYGLNNWFWNAGHELSGEDPLAGDTLAGKEISARDLRVEEGKIFIDPDDEHGVTFKLVGADLANKVLPIKLEMDIKIDELTLVRWDKSILPDIDIPEINFANMGEQNVSFINWIEFSEITLNIDFTDLPAALENNIALKVVCDKLGFEDGDPAHTKLLKNGDNLFISHPSTQLVIHENDKVVPVSFGVELMPSPHPEYMEFGPVTVSNTGDTPMNINAQVTIDFKWERAEIDLKTALENTDSKDGLVGTFPKETEDEDGGTIDLSEMGKYMDGIKFSDRLKAKIFFSGPDVIVDHFQPLLNFDAQWDGDNESVSMIEGEQQLVVGEELPKLPAKNSRGEWVYTDTGLPTGPKVKGLELYHFNNIIAAAPEDLRFSYAMKFDEEDTIEVEHKDFEGVEGDSKIRALMVLLLPLEFEADENGGHFAIPSDIFGDSEEGDEPRDLFGRENLDEDTLFTGVNIKSLSLRIDFGGRSIFAGSRLRFDEDDILFGTEGLPLGNGNSMKVTFTGEQQKRIEKNYIRPNIRFMFAPKTKVQIARNFLPVRIVISASGSYTMDFPDDLFGSGN